MTSTLRGGGLQRRRRGIVSKLAITTFWCLDLGGLCVRACVRACMHVCVESLWGPPGRDLHSRIIAIAINIINT